MTTNIERAARILHDLAAQESAEDGFPKPQWEAEPVWEKNVWLGVAQAFAAEGLLMPDPVEPEGTEHFSWGAIAEWHPKYGLGWNNCGAIEITTPAELRHEAACLLSAAAYAEEHTDTEGDHDDHA